MTPLTAFPEDDAGWFRSSFCGLTGDHCVEFRQIEGGIQLRDNKGSGGPVLTFDDAEWDAFLLGAFNGEFDIRAR